MTLSDRMKAVVLLSGGIDSTTCMAIAMAQNFQVYAMSFDYGQRHKFELKAAKKIAAVMNPEEHIVINMDLGIIGGSALTDSINVPKHRQIDEIPDTIPVTYVPARNTIFLSFALAWAEKLGTNNIFIGINAIDYSGYPDCRPEYIDAFEKMADLATRAGVKGAIKFKINTPLINMTKAQIIKKGVQLGIDYSLTHSCYDPDAAGMACGQCDSCLFRKKGFLSAGIDDPTIYKK